MVLPLQAMKIMLLAVLWLGPRLCHWMGDPKAKGSSGDICVSPVSRLLQWTGTHLGFGTSPEQSCLQGQGSLLSLLTPAHSALQGSGIGNVHWPFLHFSNTKPGKSGPCGL